MSQQHPSDCKECQSGGTSAHPLARQVLPNIAPAPKRRNEPQHLDSPPQPRPAAPKNMASGFRSTNVLTSKNWVLPPRPKPGRDPSEVLSVNNEQYRHLKKKSGKKSSESSTGLNPKIHSNIDVATSDNSSLWNQLENVTKENEDLRGIIEKLNREIESLELVKLENKQYPYVTSDRGRSLLAFTVDPTKLDFSQELKRSKRCKPSSDDLHSGLLNSNNLADARAAKLTRSASVPVNPSRLGDTCTVCAGTTCTCYTPSLNLITEEEAAFSEPVDDWDTSMFIKKEEDDFTIL